MRNAASAMLPVRKQARSLASKLFHRYISAGRPLLPVTRFLRAPLRSFYRTSPLLRHDSKRYWRSFALPYLHELLIGQHPHDFTIYRDKIKFRSFGSVMSLHGYYVGEIEHHLLQFVVSQIRPGFVAIDAGAHHGVYTLAIAYELRERGWSGVIHSFEPDPQNFALLQFNVRQNDLNAYVVLHNAAVSDTAGTQTLVSFVNENSGNTLEANIDAYDPAATVDGVRQQVATIALDQEFGEAERIDLIKLDIQGGEPRALSGATRSISRHRPVLVVEAVNEWTSSRQTRDILDRWNYDVLGVTAHGQLCRLESRDTFVSWDWVGIAKCQ